MPDSALQAVVYVSELDQPKIAKGDTADITLDAYGAGRVFPAHVFEIDAAPSMENGVSAYKVTLSFDAPDSGIKTGMTVNATIHPSL